MDGKAIVRKSFFRYECEVTVYIKATPEKIWKLVTEATEYSKWNPTMLGIEGVIGQGQVIRAKSILDPSRSYRLRVSEFVPMSRMVWSDGVAPFYRAERIFILKAVPGGVDFTLAQHIGGILFPMVSGSVPDFGGTYETVAESLRVAAEAGM